MWPIRTTLSEQELCVLHTRTIREAMRTSSFAFPLIATISPFNGAIYVQYYTMYMKHSVSLHYKHGDDTNLCSYIRQL
jgi:hypothetical protein